MIIINCNLVVDDQLGWTAEIGWKAERIIAFMSNSQFSGEYCTSEYLTYTHTILSVPSVGYNGTGVLIILLTIYIACDTSWVQVFAFVLRVWDKKLLFHFIVIVVGGLLRSALLSSSAKLVSVWNYICVCPFVEIHFYYLLLKVFTFFTTRMWKILTSFFLRAMFIKFSALSGMKAKTLAWIFCSYLLCTFLLTA